MNIHSVLNIGPSVKFDVTSRNREQVFWVLYFYSRGSINEDPNNLYCFVDLVQEFNRCFL